eukprot:gnl/TRDRNA2_/TRDRNA2_128967_c1_seq1.p1 gnl/TRDRNA2_/TRDRNA2_128967_c1~~gnl/TRDRNA2_/TRDRNA2_128967_c1_seq1.p1  ORF type:complete len:208 (-),score=20.80 gnl/TRDRNA2_/TRDRNA2_128967_c1_seq1:198-791(-)
MTASHCECPTCIDYRKLRGTYSSAPTSAPELFAHRKHNHSDTNKSEGGHVLLVLNLGEWDLLLYGLESTLRHLDSVTELLGKALRNKVLEKVGLKLDVLWLTPLPTPSHKAFTKRLYRNNQVKEAVSEYIQMRVRALRLPGLHVFDSFTALRARADDTCQVDNNHYLCAWDAPTGDAGYWILSQVLLAYICTTGEMH